MSMKLGKLLEEKTEERTKTQEEEIFGIFRILGKSFRAWAQNLIIIYPFIFIAIVLFILFLLFGLEDIIKYFWSVKFGGVDVYDIPFSAIKLFSISTKIFPIVSIIYAFCLIFITAYFGAGIIGMTKEIWRGKKISLRTMHIFGKRFIFRYIGTKILIGLMITVYFALFFLPVLITKNENLLILPLVALIPGLFLFLLLSLSVFYLVSEDLSIKKSIIRSYSILCQGKNYISLLGLILLFGLINATTILTLILMPILEICLVLPVQTLAFTLFALNRDKTFINLTKKQNHETEKTN